MDDSTPVVGTPKLRDLVRARRLELGLTQEDVAERMEMSQRWVSNLETGGVSAPRLNVMKRLAEVLRLPTEQLYLAAGVADTVEGARFLAGRVSPRRTQWDTFDDDQTDDLPVRQVDEEDRERDNSPLTAAELDELKTAMFHGFDELEPADLREVIEIMQRRKKR